MKTDIATRIAAWIQTSPTTVVFTGAGMSTESGIPDFRSPGGIWATSQPVLFDEFLASPAARYEYWRQKATAHRQWQDCRPNLGHQCLAEFERRGWVQSLITQNIDGLHQEAGSREVLELHGTARHVGCLDCGAMFPAGPLVDDFLVHDRVPDCPACGVGRLKHATISFGQALDAAVLAAAVARCESAALLLVLGSSLVVEPAASLPRLAHQAGAQLVIVNRDPTPLDRLADLVVNAPLGETLSAVAARCGVSILPVVPGP